MSLSTLAKAVWEQNRALLLTVAALGVLSLGLFIYQQQLLDSRLVDLQIEQIDLQQQLRQRPADPAAHDRAQSELLAADLRQFQELIPEKQQFSDFLGELFTMAERSGLDIQQINYAPKVDQDSGLLAYGLNFSVHGTYAQLKNFVQLLENSPRLLIIERIGLSGSEQAGTELSDVQLQLQLTTYFKEGQP